MRNFRRINNKISNVILKGLIITGLSIILSGCDLVDGLSGIGSIVGKPGSSSDMEQITDTLPAKNGIAVYNTDGEEITTSESVIDMMEDEDEKESFISASDLVSANDRLFNDSEEYAYSKLTDEEQTIYREIYAILTELQNDILLSTLKTDVIDHSFRCVLMDHPEIFYVTGYSISKYTMGDEIKKITFNGSYTMDKDEVLAKQEVVDRYVNECLSGISQSASDYEKVKYVYEYLIDDNTYDLESENNQNILSVCENQITVCQGYSKMTQLLLNKLDVFCTLVYGTSENTAQADSDGTIYKPSDKSEWGAHVWNIVKVNGKYYNLDTTWGDASFLFSNENGDIMDGPDINYDYLLVPDSMILDTHLPNPAVDMPICDSMDDNYYVHEGLYFTEVDKDRLRTAFNNAYANGEQYVSIKCSDADAYERMRDYLFGNENVFDYLNGTSVRYVEYADRNALSIYL